jgi:hypothetical protein
MATFSELQATLNSIRYRRAIVSKIVEWVDEQFLPGMDGTPKLVLLTTDKIKVPEEAFNELAEIMNGWTQNLVAEEQKLLNSDVAVTAKVEPAEEVPTEELKS